MKYQPMTNLYRMDEHSTDTSSEKTTLLSNRRFRVLSTDVYPPQVTAKSDTTTILIRREMQRCRDTGGERGHG